MSERVPLGYSHRLHQRSDFLKFFQGSHVFRLERCAVFRVPNSTGHFRLGVTFKVKLNSIERNALRRRIRETIRRLGPRLGSYDYNVVVRRVERPVLPYARALARELEAALPNRSPVPAKAGRAAS